MPQETNQVSVLASLFAEIKLKILRGKFIPSKAPLAALPGAPRR